MTCGIRMYGQGQARLCFGVIVCWWVGTYSEVDGKISVMMLQSEQGEGFHPSLYLGEMGFFAFASDVIFHIYLNSRLGCWKSTPVVLVGGRPPGCGSVWCQAQE